MSTLKPKIAIPIIALTAALALGFGATVSLVNSNVICRGISAGGITIGGLTRDEASRKLSSSCSSRLLKTVDIHAGGRRWSGQLRDFGVHADVDGAVAEAYKTGRDGNFFQRALVCLTGSSRKVPLKYVIDRKQFDSTLDKIARSVESPHEDAVLTRTGSGFTVTSEKIGVKLDRDESVKMFERAVDKGDLMLGVKLKMDMPDVTAADLSKVDTVLASYTTRFPAWRIDRTHNIRMAASKVDGTVVKPGEAFSYNQTVGPRLKSLGFRDAPIFVKGKLVPGTGGGICQLSSTIYNAALLANMKIIERSNHSSLVPYVPAGRDATVAYGLLDLRFRNSTSAPIYIASRMAGSYLHVDIYGSSQDKSNVNIQVVKNGSMKATVYRIVKLDGKVASRELVSRDRYRPAEPMAAVEKPKKRPKSDEPVVRAYPAKHASAKVKPQVNTD